MKGAMHVVLKWLTPCFLEMVDPRTNRNVLVCISHANIRSNDMDAYKMLPDDLHKRVLLPGHNSYISRFYAFEATRPYRTVALSGHFCWPLLTSTGHDDSNQFANKGDKLLYIEPTNQTGVGWCPKIHFVMSILYKVNSNSKSVTLSLGVNDCTPHFIEVKTSDIKELPFYGFSCQRGPSLIK
jgi:hypothetical protein